MHAAEDGSDNYSPPGVSSPDASDNEVVANASEKKASSNASKMTKGKSKKKKKVESSLKHDDVEDRGDLQPLASSILMSLLYAARVGRFDLLRAICALASKVSKWTRACDRKLLRLIRYVNCSLDHRQVGWVGDAASELSPNLYVDADIS